SGVQSLVRRLVRTQADSYGKHRRVARRKFRDTPPELLPGGSVLRAQIRVRAYELQSGRQRLVDHQVLSKSASLIYEHKTIEECIARRYRIGHTFSANADARDDNCQNRVRLARLAATQKRARNDVV